MYQKTKLKNGLTLLTAPLKETKAVTVLVLLPVGSRYETQTINGSSHFIEHLMFKGTKKRPTSLDITKELDSVGAEYNAFTSKDHTGYYIKISADKIELAFDLLSDMLFNSVFDANEINKERGVIIEEINMYEDNPLMYLGAFFEETVFGDQPLGWHISGPRQVIKKITRRQIIQFKDKFYKPSQMILSVAGNFKKAHVSSLTKKYFGKSFSNKTKNNFKTIKLNQIKPKVNIRYQNTQQVQLGLGVPSYGSNNSKLYALYLLAVILGGNMSSRLFMKVREEKGLAYYIKSDISSYRDVGALLIQAGLDKRRIKEAITLILKELRNVKENGVTEKELKSAKEFLKGKLILDLEDSESVCDWYGKQELLLNKTLTPEEKLNKIFNVKIQQIKKVAEELLKEEKLNLVLIGPFKNKSEFQKLLKIS